jgi:hypothetical protein
VVGIVGESKSINRAIIEAILLDTSFYTRNNGVCLRLKLTVSACDL